MDGILENEKFYTTQEVTDFFRVARSTLYRWIDEGKIKRLKLGHKNLFRESDIRRLVEELGIYDTVRGELRISPSGKVRYVVKVPRKKYRTKLEKRK